MTRLRFIFRSLPWLLAVVLAVVVTAWLLARPVTPDTFYLPPANPPAKPGALLRQEAFVRGVPAGAQAWRMLYTTTRSDGAPAVASAIVMTSRASGSNSRPVIAWTHGTTGVVPGCAPSLLDDPFANVPALRQLIDKGWVYVATDYVGLGTSGPHPYLIGEGEARSALDSIRALRQMEGIRVQDEVVVWGHSQGGHAALWTGITAPNYAPEVNILGVAVIAPASDLPALVNEVHATPIGRIMSAFVLRSYASAYPDVEFAAYVPEWKRWLASDIAGRCLAGHETLFSVAESLLAGGSIFDKAPTSGHLGERLTENIPKSLLQQPLLIAQGLADDLVPPDVQSRFVRDRCAAGEELEYRTYAGRDHLSVLAPDSPLTNDLVRWTQDRIDNVPSSATCAQEDTQSGRRGFFSPGSHSTPHAGPHGARPSDLKGPPLDGSLQRWLRYKPPRPFHPVGCITAVRLARLSRCRRFRPSPCPTHYGGHLATMPSADFCPITSDVAARRAVRVTVGSGGDSSAFALALRPAPMATSAPLGFDGSSSPFGPGLSSTPIGARIACRTDLPG